MKLHKSITSTLALTLVGLPLALVGCSASDTGPAGLAGAADGSSPTNAVDTGVPGEQFAALDVSGNRVTGVFTKDGEGLAFDVDHRTGNAALRFSSADGEPLYSVVQDETGYELRVGSEFRGYMPKGEEHAAANPSERASSPAGFEAKGDLPAALEHAKSSALRHVAALAAALGRVGVDGGSVPTSLSLHLIAQQLTQDLGLQLDPGVGELTNEIIAGRASKAPVDKDAPATSTPAQTPSLLHAEGLTLGTGTPISCRKAPCPSGQIVVSSGPLSGCCVTPATPAVNTDYSNTPACGSGVGREQFAQLSSDPCRDSCLGMCGPGCDSWGWVCGDTAVHAACWNHDRVSCPGWIDTGWGFSVPNPDYPRCMTEYAAYSAVIFAETVPGPFCDNTAWADAVSLPWWGLPAARASFFVQYK